MRPSPVTVLTLLLTLLLAFSPTLAEVTNLLTDPGYEENNGAWQFDARGQPEARANIQGQSYRHGDGWSGAKVTVPNQPRQHVSWYQDVTIVDPEHVPNEASIWFNGPAGATLTAYPITLDDHESPLGEPKTVALRSAGDWEQNTLELDLPESTRRVRFEVRVAARGEFFFDDAALVKHQAAAPIGKPEGITFIGFRRTWGNATQGEDPMPAPMRQALEKAGLGPIRGIEWEDVTPEALRRSKAVIVMIWPHRMVPTPRDLAVIELLKDYAAAGGGVLFSADRQQRYHDHVIPMALAEAFGTTLLLEQTHTNPDKTWKIGTWPADTYTYTDQVKPPINEGVEGVLFQVESNWAYRAVVPFVAREPWKVVLDSGENAWTEPLDPQGLTIIDQHRRDEGFERNIPLVGIRPFGDGRVGYFGVNMPNIIVRAVDNEDGMEVYTSYARDGYDGHPSDMLRLITNLLTWLGANAASLESTNLAMDYAEDTRQFDAGWKIHRGVIGPRTSYSSGTASPDEYVAKAKALGLDFIVFLEEFGAMDRANFNRLRADCRRLTTNDFIAVPGITWTNEDGNHQFAYSDQLQMPSDALVDETGQHILGGDESDGIGELRWLYELNSAANQAGWYNFKDNPYPHYDGRNIAAMGVVTQKGNQLIERVVDEFAYSNWHAQALWPHALNLATSPDELDGVATGEVYVNLVGAHGYEHLYTNLTTIKARTPMHRYPGSTPFGSTSVSTGPVINLDMPRADTDTDDGLIYCRALQAWPLDLTVTSDIGLKEVRLMDGQRMVRRFLPNGDKAFTFETGMTKEYQHYLWVHAIDTNGGEAFTRAINCNAWLMREVQCTDRNNQLFTLMSKREDGTRYMLGYSNSAATPDKGPWNPYMRPVGGFIFDPKLGIGSMNYDGSPEGEPSIWTAPEVWWDGQRPGGITKVGWLRNLVAGHEGGPHNRPERIIASADVLVGDMVMDGVFPLDPTKEVCHVWHTMQPVQESKTLKTTMRRTQYLPKIEGIHTHLIEQTFEVLRDIPVGKGKDWAIQFGEFGKAHRIETQGRKLGDAPIDTSTTPGKFDYRKGDYVGFYNDPFGSLVIYNLGEPLILEGHPKRYFVRIPAEGDVIKKGTTHTIRLLAVGMHNQVEDPIALSETVKTAYGLGTQTQGYDVQLSHGQVTGREYTLDLETGSMGNVQGVITGLDDLPGTLGSRITGLNQRWTAALYRGGDDPNVRIMPIDAEGVGRAVLQPDLDRKPLFLGHPYTTGHEDVVLNLSRTRDWKSWQLEIHNPTDQPISGHVVSAQGWPGPELQHAYELDPGSSEMITIGAAVP